MLSSAFLNWRESGKTYHHRDHAIFYQEAGSGPLLLAIHGFPSASWDWFPIWSTLSRRFHVIAPDMIGRGWSDKPKRYAYSVLDQADLTHDLLAQLGVRSVHLFAHDLGVSIAQELLGARPAR